MNDKLKIRVSWEPVVVLIVACANHFLTFLAYDWYAGIDCYSYDVTGLQLLSGYHFDIFSIMFRAPFVPLLKNILYLIFEGHPYALSLFVHSWGVAAAILAYRIGKRFGRAIGLILGLLVAGNLPLSAHFHHISITTVFIPLLLVAFDRFCAWIKHPERRRLLLLVAVTFLCCMTHPSGLALIPIFWLFGWVSHRRWKQAAAFLLASTVLYYAVGLLYYVNFGCLQIPNVRGWQLYIRTAFAVDRQFSEENGPASSKINGYLQQSVMQKIKKTDMRTYHMSALCLAQKELGYSSADNLFLRAGVESILADPEKFLYFSALRFWGHFDLAEYDWLKFKETSDETPSGHMWGFDQRRMIGKQNEFARRHPSKAVPNPLEWERQVLKARLLNGAGIPRHIPALPPAYALSGNVKERADGGLEFLYFSDGNMSERLWHGLALDAYFYYEYWGRRGWSMPALRMLGLWDAFFMARPPLRIFLHRFLWVLWIAAILFFRKGAQRTALVAMLSYTVFYGVCIAVFSDNFGGRQALYTESFIWLGGLCGVADIIHRARIRCHNALTSKKIRI